MTHQCPINGAVDVKRQYVWHVYNPTSESFEPVLESGDFVSELSRPVGSHYQQYLCDGIGSRLFTGESSAQYKCIMPDNNGYINQTVWEIDTTVSKSKLSFHLLRLLCSHNTVCPRWNRYGESSAMISKNMFAVFTILFLI